MSWLRRRMMANVGGGILPQGYTQVGWLQTRANMNSSQLFDFFDTGLTPTDDIEVQAVFNQNGRTSVPSYGMFLGSRLASNSQEFMVAGYQNIALSYHGRKSLGYWPNTSANNNWNTYSFVGNTLDVNGHTLTISRTSGSAPINSLNIYVGCLNQKNSAIQAMVCTIKELSISTGGVNHEYIPCLNSLGQAGLFDLAAQSFIAPHGGSYFIHEPVNDVIMLNYTPMGSVFYFHDPVVIDFINGESIVADITLGNASSSADQRILTLSGIGPFAAYADAKTIHLYYKHSDSTLGIHIGSNETQYYPLSASRFSLSVQQSGIYVDGNLVHSDIDDFIGDGTTTRWYVSSTEGSEIQRSYCTYHSVTIVRP